jgi:hypothetical protein
MRATHLDDELVERVLHGELSPASEVTVRAHLAGCAICQTTLREAEREEARIVALLRSLDRPAPRIEYDVVAAASGRRPAAASSPAAALSSRHSIVRHSFARRSGRWAAAALFALGVGGAAYALPGSPLPRLLRRLIPWTERPATDTPPAPPAAPATGSGGGITVDPGERLTIVFRSAPATGHAIVSLTEAGRVSVRAISGGASFTSDVDRVTIDATGTATGFEIAIPRTAADVEIVAGGRSIFRKTGPRVETDARADGDARWRLALGRPR